MSGQIIQTRSIALAIPLLVWGVGIGAPTAPARADDCLAAPHSAAPNGSHWYYHTDRPNRRKCWFLGPPGQAAKLHTTAKLTPAATTVASVSAVEKPDTASADASMSTSSATTHEPVQQPAQETSTAPSIPEAPPPLASASSQTGAQAAGAAPAATIAWPDPAPVGTVQAQKPNLVPSDAPADSAPPTVDVRAPDVSEGAAQGGATTTNAPAGAASPAATFVEILLVVALGLIVAGLLYRVVMKISVRHGQRINIDHPKSEWIGNRHHREWRNDRQRQGSVYKGEEFIDDLHPSLVPVAGDYSARRPLATDDKRQNDPRGKDRGPQITDAPQIADEFSGRENRLAELIRDLDQMLQSRKGA
jgi:hypothetical protein